MKIINYILFICLFLSKIILAQSNQKLAQSGLQFLSVVSDARAAAMGEAMTSLNAASCALFFNPAGMSEMEHMIDISASVNRWIADITHYTFSFAFSPAAGKYGVIGLSAQSIEYGDFLGTVTAENEAGYIDTGVFHVNAMAFGLGYARKLTNKFMVGAQVRLVHQDLGESTIAQISLNDTIPKKVNNRLNPVVFDFGTIYHTGIKSLSFGMSLRNFSREYKYAEEEFQAPLVFNMGISMDMLDWFEGIQPDQKLIMSIDASHFRSHPEQIKIGLDYSFKNVLALRIGYISSTDERGLSYGVGLGLKAIQLDYAYTPFGLFNDVQRLTARFQL